MAQVIWTATGLRTLRQALGYVARQSPPNAEKLRQRLVHAPRRLEQFPESGQRVPEFEQDHVRELIVKSYRIIYLVRGDTCFIAYVVHGSRDLPSLLSLEDLESGE